MRILGKYRLSTFQIISLGFIMFILFGALLLMIPAASVPKGHAAFSDCLFTATSAVCVTGLVVQDTATFWTPLGQAIILFLIQVGGMGVITAAICLSFISGRKIGLLQRSLMQEAISAPQLGGIIRLTRFIVTTALAIELLGAILLLPVFIQEFGPLSGIWRAVFHSVSAFCNAGFDLMGVKEQYSSLTSFPQHGVVNLTIVALITIGGIGFLVWDDIKTHRFHFKHYRLQSKIVLTTSVILIMIPFLWLFFLEYSHLPAGQRILPSLFQSVTLRTAGFNTTDLNMISDGGQSLMIIWMLIGGSPGSTAGGLKTSTLAVLLLTAVAVFKRKEHVECFGRRIGEGIIRTAIAIVLMYFVLFFISGLIISTIEHMPLLACLFETASAIGTVGLTLGITSHLGQFSRLILIILMFLGRVGGLTVIYAAQHTHQSTKSVFPLEKITVG